MSRRDKTLAKALYMLQRDLAGAQALEDPFAGIPPQLDEVFLYATTSPQSWRNGWDATEGSAGRVKIHRDGHGTSHTGACALAPEEPLHERLIRICSLDRDEAELVRDAVAHPGTGQDTAALRLRVSLRTYLRRDAAIRAKLRAYRVEFLEATSL